jgi:hypothetical protein
MEGAVESGQRAAREVLSAPVTVTDHLRQEKLAQGYTHRG